MGNLIGNAIKLTCEGGVIQLSAAHLADEVANEVRDTGVGIVENELSEIFKPYWHSEKRKKGGRGSGLSIAKAIVEAHGRQIVVGSELHKASTFRVTLPADPS